VIKILVLPHGVPLNVQQSVDAYALLAADYYPGINRFSIYKDRYNAPQEVNQDVFFNALLNTLKRCELVAPVCFSSIERGTHFALVEKPDEWYVRIDMITLDTSGDEKFSYNAVRTSGKDGGKLASISPVAVVVRAKEVS
jgi:hypothetical protein